MKLTPEIMEFSKLDLETNNSHISNYYAMKYNDFNGDMKNFLKAVTLEDHFTNTSISSKDLAIFARNCKLEQGVLPGRKYKKAVDNISGKGSRSKRQQHFDGDISLSGLPDINTTFIDLGRTTSAPITMTLLPLFQLKNITQPQLSKLGNIYYSEISPASSTTLLLTEPFQQTCNCNCRPEYEAA